MVSRLRDENRQNVQIRGRKLHWRLRQLGMSELWLTLLACTLPSHFLQTKWCISQKKLQEKRGWHPLSFMAASSSTTTFSFGIVGPLPYKFSFVNHTATKCLGGPYPLSLSLPQSMRECGTFSNMLPSVFSPKRRHSATMPWCSRLH